MVKIVADAHIPYIKEYFGGYGELILKNGRTIEANDVKDADILLVRSITPVNADLLADSTVKLVGSVTAGADHLDTHWMDEVGIQWEVATGFNAPPVADYVVSAIAALQRKKWLKTQGVRAAVIGVGNVGSLVVERLKVLGFEVVLCDPLRALNDANFISTSLETLEEFDVISLHVPLVKTGPFPTYHFIDHSFLQKQKPGCVLLNASRGAVIHSETLKEAGEHLQWCFDVWEHEPRIDKAVLMKAVLATPHIAGYSLQSKIRGIEMIYHLACEKKFIEPLANKPPTAFKQTLNFSGKRHTWQDIVLGVFNPLIITEMMRDTLLSSEDYGHLFDEMRQQFNFRHEFGWTEIKAQGLAEEDINILTKLGLTIRGD